MKVSITTVAVAFAIIFSQNAFAIVCADGSAMRPIGISKVEGRGYRVALNEAEYSVVNHTASPIEPGRFMACYTLDEVPGYSKFINITFLAEGDIGIE